MEPTLVIHVVVEIDIYTGGRVVQQEPTRLGDGKLLCLWVNKQRSDTQRSLQQALHGIIREFGSLYDFLSRHAVFGIQDHLQDAELHHES